MKYIKQQLCLAKHIQLFGPGTKKMSQGTLQARIHWMEKHLSSNQWQTLSMPIKDLDEVRRSGIDLAINVDAPDIQSVQTARMPVVKSRRTQKQAAKANGSVVGQVEVKQEPEESQADPGPPNILEGLGKRLRTQQEIDGYASEGDCELPTNFMELEEYKVLPKKQRLFKHTSQAPSEYAIQSCESEQRQQEAHATSPVQGKTRGRQHNDQTTLDLAVDNSGTDALTPVLQEQRVQAQQHIQTLLACNRQGTTAERILQAQALKSMLKKDNIVTEQAVEEVVDATRAKLLQAA